VNNFLVLLAMTAVAKIIDAAKLRHIAWSHFESDEIGALNDWLSLRLKPSRFAVSSASS
jgi:flavorubredoxin